MGKYATQVLRKNLGGRDCAQYRTCDRDGRNQGKKKSLICLTKQGTQFCGAIFDNSQPHFLQHMSEPILYTVREERKDAVTYERSFKREHHGTQQLRHYCLEHLFRWILCSGECVETK
ncbi:hypothetical protein BLNAU_7589 [Blattamonas nauphoetae]|uniref:Uncharacterized protein n=1 Tax=Blattamonas nauphoetae TaxID=2049346 RepID=A0ABQ9Y108_9EUKA|nr:hypothetical protein BLNAU_7589 [Blattamonas nauphoetae]